MGLRSRAVFYSFSATLLAASAAVPFRLGVVSGNSMEPTYRSGALYVMQRVQDPARELQRGDVVVFKREGRIYIKRILGVPGDGFLVVPRTVDTQREALVRAWEVPILQKMEGSRYFHIKVAHRRVPPGTVYVVGDHLEASEDSRSFGPIDLSQIQGKVLQAPLPPVDIARIARTRPHQNRRHRGAKSS